MTSMHKDTNVSLLESTCRANTALCSYHYITQEYSSPLSLTVRFMKETNFLKTAIISLNVLDGIPFLTTSTVSYMYRKCYTDDDE